MAINPFILVTPLSTLLIFHNFTFFSGGQSYYVRAEIQEQAVHYYGKEQESKIIERFAKYSVDGVPGAGITEWQYRNTLIC